MNFFLTTVSTVICFISISSSKSISNTEQQCCDGIAEVHRNIIKPPDDYRSIEALTLTNGLKVLLVSDPSVETAAAAISVNVGSFSDPESLQGLAHFLEHILILNTEKLKNTSDSMHEGVHLSAMTDKDQTLYYSSVPESRLQEALQRLAAIFGSSVISEKLMNDELNAINSESIKDENNDGERVHSVLRENANQSHPFSKFPGGNFESLSTVPISMGINVRKEMEKFYDQYYSSNIMCLSVLGKEPIEKLKQLVVPLFKSIENKNITAPKWHQNPFERNQLKKKINIVPIGQMQKLILLFPTPNLKNNYRSKPESYISYMLEQKGDGSLYAYLIKEGLSSVVVSITESISGFGFFKMSLSLTEKGFGRVDEVIETIFKYINMVKKAGPQRWIFNEIQRLQNLSFQFYESVYPSFEMMIASQNMQTYPIDEVFSAYDVVNEFQPQLITELLEFIDPYNMLVLVVSPKFSGKADKREKYYGVRYCVEEIEEEFLNRLRNAKSTEFHLPHRNEFEATKFVLKEKENYEIPTVIKKSENSEIWFFQDQKFGAKAYFEINFKSAAIRINPLRYVAAQLFVNIIKEEIEEYTSNGDKAGINYGIFHSEQGINFFAFGHDDKLNFFILKIMDKFSSFKFNENVFNSLKFELFESFKNIESESILLRSKHYAKVILSKNQWTDEEMIAIENKLTFDVFKDIVQKIFSKVFIQSFAFGNVESREVIELVDGILMLMRRSFLLLPPDFNTFNSEAHKLPDSSSFILKKESVAENDNAILDYFQIGELNHSESVKLKILGKIMQFQCFDILRTKEQLGYVVNCGTRDFASNVSGVLFQLRSPNSTAYLDGRIEAFLQSFRNELTNLSIEEFDGYRNAVITEYRENPSDIATYAYEMQSEILENTFLFDRRKDLIAAALNTTKNDVLQLFDEYVKCGAKKRAKLSIRIELNQHNGTSALGENTCSATEPFEIDDIKKFKFSIGHYPLENLTSNDEKAE